MRARPLGRRRERSQDGAAAVEFALIVPVLLLVVAGVMNFGFVFAQQISLNNAARQAVRYSVVDGRTCSQIQAEGKNSAETVGMTGSQVPTPVITNCGTPSAKPCAGRPPGTNITVTMQRPGASNSWVINMPPFNLIPVPTLTGTGVMRCEFS